MPDRTPKDRPEGRVVLLVVGILVLSTLDAISTIALLGTGQITEWNPFMAALIERDVQLFAGVKTALTGGGVFVLASLADRHVFNRQLAVDRILKWVFLTYVLLLTYHLALIARVALGS
jgi:hypothetical protein